MYPNAFLDTYWRMDLRPEVFVAMSFEKAYEERYEKVIAPAVKALTVRGNQLEPFRVDLSKTGDCIITQIIDGIAHCELFLADISSIRYDKHTRKASRNGNVMYEVGLALACRQPSEVLLVKDDPYPSLFDVSTIPYKRIHFGNVDSAKGELTLALKERLKERDYLNDARVQRAVATLSPEELSLLEEAAKLEGFSEEATLTIDETSARQAMHRLPNPRLEVGLPRLLDKQILKPVDSRPTEGKTVYKYTILGCAVVLAIKQGFKATEPIRP